jgi:hypothetical protein
LNVGWRLRWIFFGSFNQELFFLRLLPVLLRGGRGGVFLPSENPEPGWPWQVSRPPMSSSAARKCLCCNEKFRPDARNRRHQQYCAKAACRKASKAASQARWLSKPENENYFRGSANCERVRQWRLANPGYSRRKAACRREALQDVSNPQPIEKEPLEPSCATSPLQDLLLPQPALLVGLISVVTGHALQDDIAESARRFLNRGRDILRMARGSPDLPDHENQAHPVPRAAAPRASPV